MSFLDKFFAPKEHKPDAGRRAFLRNVITAAPAAVAAVAAIDLAFVPELKAAAREELFKLDQMVEGDLGMQSGRVLVAAPKTVFDPTARVWRSVANEAGAWADYVSKVAGMKHERALAVTTRLARLIDADLRAANAGVADKIDVRLPQITRQWTDQWGEKQCEVGMGVHKTTLFDGTEQLAVMFEDKAPRLGQNVNGVWRPFETDKLGWNDVSEKLSSVKQGAHSVPTPTRPLAESLPQLGSGDFRV